MKSKKVFKAALAATLVCLLSNNAMAHQVTDRPHRAMSLSYSPVIALFGAHIVRFQYKLDDVFAPHVSFGLIDNRWSIKPDFNNQPGTFYELRLGARYFITGTPHDHGLFLESSGLVAYAKTPSGNAITVPYAAGPDQWLLGAATTIGYEYVNDWGRFIDGSIGAYGYVGFGFPNSDFTGNNLALFMWHPVVMASVGYAW